MAPIDQGAGMRITIAIQATDPTMAKTRNPTTIARATIGIRSHNLTIEEAEGGDWWFISLMEDSKYRASLCS
jgi:hypothetical protein